MATTAVASSGRRIHQQRPLGEAQVRGSLRGKPPIEPRLLAHPHHALGEDARPDNGKAGGANPQASHQVKIDPHR